MANAPIPQGAAVDSGAYETAGASAPPTTYAVDSFERTDGSGWGSATSGGSYALIGPEEEFSVSGGIGSMVTPRANSRAATLNAVSATDVESTFRVRVNKPGTGSGNYAYFVARSVASEGREYRLKVRFSSSGVFVHGTKVIGNVKSDIEGEGATGLNPAPGTFIRARAASGWHVADDLADQGMGRRSSRTRNVALFRDRRDCHSGGLRGCRPARLCFLRQYECSCHGRV